MRKLSKNEWFAVVVSLLVVGFVFTTGQSFLSIFTSDTSVLGSPNTSANATDVRNDSGMTAQEQTASALQASQDQNNSSTNSSNTMDSTPNNSFASSVSGFEIQDVVVGTGVEATAGKLITVHYSGAFTDGKIFDSSYVRGTPFSFTLGAGQVIPGWDKGFDGMKVGGKRRLVIPPAFGYGATGVPGAIPGNSTLVFEVELLDVK